MSLLVVLHHVTWESFVSVTRKNPAENSQTFYFSELHHKLDTIVCGLAYVPRRTVPLIAVARGRAQFPTLSRKLQLIQSPSGGFKRGARDRIHRVPNHNSN